MGVCAQRACNARRAARSYHLLDLSTEESFRRVSRRRETERYETLERQRLIRERYLKLFEEFGESDHIAVIESDEDKDVTQANIRVAALKLFEGGNA